MFYLLVSDLEENLGGRLITDESGLNFRCNKRLTKEGHEYELPRHLTMLAESETEKDLKLKWIFTEFGKIENTEDAIEFLVEEGFKEIENGNGVFLENEELHLMIDLFGNQVFDSWVQNSDGTSGYQSVYPISDYYEQYNYESVGV